MDANTQNFDLDMLTKADIGLYENTRFFADYINCKNTTYYRQLLDSEGCLWVDFACSSKHNIFIRNTDKTSEVCSKSINNANTI